MSDFLPHYTALYSEIFFVTTGPSQPPRQRFYSINKTLSARFSEARALRFSVALSTAKSVSFALIFAPWRKVYMGKAPLIEYDGSHPSDG